MIVSHVGFEPDPKTYAETLFRRGANVSFDRIGFKIFFPDAHWLDLVRWAIDEGWLGQILLSHDAGVFAHGLEVASGDNIHDDFTYISRVFLPKLRAAGVSDPEIDTIMTTNAQRVLTFVT